MKKFIIIGGMNAITYKEIFPLIKDNKMWLGFTCPKNFQVTLEKVEDEKKQYEENGKIYQKFGNICWFTNIPHKKRNTPLDLYKKYSNEYQKYDNYDAINVDDVKMIPNDYDGVMGVPITYLFKYCPTQFELLGYEHNIDGKGGSINQFEINGKGTYKRLLIRKVK